ncbi:hypothetical protein ACHAXT_010465 [Thalassiosira profunda]
MRALADGFPGRMMALAELRGRVGVVEGRGGEVAGGEAAGVTVQVWRWCTWTAGGGGGSVGHEGARRRLRGADNGAGGTPPALGVVEGRGGDGGGAALGACSDAMNVRRYEWDFGVVRAPLLEMGHVLRRHTQKRAVKGRLLSTIWEALVYEDHDDLDESFGEAIGEILWKGASHLGERSFSRADEYHADEAAWDLLASTYSAGRQSARRYHQGSVRRLLQALWDYAGGSGDTTSWESTHLGTKGRMIEYSRSKRSGIHCLR